MSKDVDKWLKDYTEQQMRAIETASKVFDDEDFMDVNIIEGIFARESSFGKSKNIGSRGDNGPAGYFQQKKDAANRSGIKTEKNNDGRFDIDFAAIGAARQMKHLDGLFGKKSNLGSGIVTIKISSKQERMKFVIAAYNAGEGRIARAQQVAQADGKDPTKWEEVKNYLAEAGASEAQIKEVLEYVEKVLEYAEEFSKKSKARKKFKDKDLRESAMNEDGHWITLKNGRHVFVENKKD